jgi:hypothetical protein
MLLKLFPLNLYAEPLRAFLLSIALGFIFLSGLTFVLLVLNIGYPILFAVLIYLTGSIGLVTIYKSFVSAFKEFYNIAFEYRKLLRHFLAFCILFFLLLYFYITLAPTTAWDSLAYHYPLPKLWLKAHSFYNIHEIAYSNFPSSAELIFLLGFAVKSDIVANHLTWFAGFLSILYLFYFGKRHFTPEAGLAAGIIFLSYPVVYIDLFLVFYIFASFDLLYDWVYSRSLNVLILTGILSGFTLCIKHASYLTLLFYSLIIIISSIFHKYNKYKSFYFIFLFIIISLIFPLGWYIKSYIYTGNPVYPFMYHYFGGTYSNGPDIMYWANPKVTIGVLQTLLYPFLATFNTAMVQFPFRLLPPVILVLIPFIVFRFNRCKFSQLIFPYAICFIIIISIIEPGEPRYNLAAWAFLGLIAVDAALRFEPGKRWFGNIIIPTFLVIPLAFGSIYISMRYINYRHLFVFGRENVTQYYSGNNKYKPLDCYPVINWLNVNINGPENGKILLAESRVFLLNDALDYIIAYPFQTDEVWDWDKVVIKDIQSMFIKYGIKYIAIDYGPNYRGICESWFIIHNESEANVDDLEVLNDDVSLGMGNRHFMEIAGYSSKHLTFIKNNNKSGILLYDGRFKNIYELFGSKGNVDVKLASSIMWCANNGFIRKVFDDKAGAIFEVIY